MKGCRIIVNTIWSLGWFGTSDLILIDLPLRLPIIFGRNDIRLVLVTWQPCISSQWKHHWGLILQALVDKLGRLFEPYVIQILPMLLACFGDGDGGVREAADSTSRAIMSHLSGHGAAFGTPRPQSTSAPVHVLPSRCQSAQDVNLWDTGMNWVRLLSPTPFRTDQKFAKNTSDYSSTLLSPLIIRISINSSSVGHQDYGPAFQWYHFSVFLVVCAQ